MKKILVIDDQPSNVVLLQGILKREGFEILTASDGKSGIEIVDNEKPDLILLDVIMPEVNGFEVCKKIKSKPETSAIPIILVTAKDSSKDIKEGFLAGAVDYVKKPFDRTELLMRIKSALNIKETHLLLLEAEKVKTFTATVVTTNHKIKQPLTIINLSLTALKRELSKENISKEGILKRIEYIENAVSEINESLKKLSAVEKPEFSEYVNNIKMINLNEQKLTD